LDAGQAAAYVGISKTAFLEGVKRGVLPKEVRVGHRVLWDIKDLDDAFDRLKEGGSLYDDLFLEGLRHVDPNAKCEQG
jgi:predicted DNA-binding transcriptional regulator AlpA